MRRRRLTDFELGWLVGLIEGDGCVTHDGKNPRIVVKMTDLDVVERFAALVGVPVHGPYKYEDTQIGPKPYYVAYLNGLRARSFMASASAHFSSRRREQIAAIIGGQVNLQLQ